MLHAKQKERISLAMKKAFVYVPFFIRKERSDLVKYLPDAARAKAADCITIAEYGIPSMVLMERAALCTVEALEAEQVDISDALIVCGSGNNGGDGFAIARLLYLKRKCVTVWFVGKEGALTEDAMHQYSIIQKMGVPIVNCVPKKEYSVIIDSILGIGLSRTIEGTYREAIELLNEMSGKKVAVDIPSGINATDGRMHQIAFQADLTVTFAFEKLGMVLFPGYSYTGKVIVADIGIMPEALKQDTGLVYTLEKQDGARLLPKRKKHSHKGSYGKVLIIAGSKGMSGAAYFSGKACYQTGAGLVKIYTCEENRAVLQQLLPEAIIMTYTTINKEEIKVLAEWADVALIGPGLGTSKEAKELFQLFMNVFNKPCVIDADGLNLLSQERTLLNRLSDGTKQVIVTPHILEFARLLNLDMEQVKEERQALTEHFAATHNIVCVSKDTRTFVAQNGKPLFINTAGNSALAKAGSGDVLAGIITGLLAQGMDSYTAGTLGVYLHALAGDKARETFGSYSVSASILTDIIADVIKELEEV